MRFASLGFVGGGSSSATKLEGEVMIKKLSLLSVAVGFCAVFGSAAHAAPCSTTAVTLTEIDGSAFGPVDSNACEEFAGNIGAGSTLIDGLNDGTFFAGEFDAGSIFTFAGKDETAADNGADVEADVDQVSGDWSADFGTAVINNIVVALKGGKEGAALFLFKDLSESGSTFAGTFDMFLAGLVNKQGDGQDLSNLSVAGIYVDLECPPEDPDCDGGGGIVPLPAGLPLLLSALAVGGFVVRRKRNS